MKLPSCKRISFCPSKKLANGGKKLHFISYKSLRKLIRSEVKKALKQNVSKNANADENRLNTKNLGKKRLNKKLQLDYGDMREIIQTEIENVLSQCLLQDEVPTNRSPVHAKQIEQLKSEINIKNKLCDNYVQNLYQSVMSISAELNAVTERLESMENVMKKDQSNPEEEIENVVENQLEPVVSLPSTNAILHINDDTKTLPDILKMPITYEASEPCELQNPGQDYGCEIYFGRNKTTDYDFFKNLIRYKKSENESNNDKDEIVYNSTTTTDLENDDTDEDKELKLKRTQKKLRLQEKSKTKKETRCPQCCRFRSPQGSSS